MSESADNLDFFERILKEKSKNKPLKLYTNNKVTNTLKYGPRDVLRHVSSQIKAIHQADSVKTIKSVNNLSEYNKQSCFLSVSKLPVYKGVQKHNTKFETQYVSDTQLIDLLQNVEENRINTAMIQDFNTSFKEEEGQFKGRISEDFRSAYDEESQNKVKEAIIAEKIINNDIKTSPIKFNCEVRLSPLLEIEKDVNILELVTKTPNTKQDTVCNVDNKLRIENSYVNQKHNSTDNVFQDKRNTNERVESHIPSNLIKDTIITKRDLCNIKSRTDKKCLKEVVFMSLEFNKNRKDKNITEPKPDTTLEESGTKVILNKLEQTDYLANDVNMPLSILSDKKESQINHLKDDEACCVIDENYLRENKENKELSVSKEIFTEDYDSYKREEDKNLSKLIDLHEYVLKERNFGADSRNILYNHTKRNKEDSLSVTKELFTEDYIINDDVERKKVIIEAENETLDDITLEPNKTVYNDIGTDTEFESNFENEVKTHDLANVINLKDEEQKCDNSFKNDLPTELSLAEEGLQTELEYQIFKKNTLKANRVHSGTPNLLERNGIEEDMTNNIKINNNKFLSNCLEVARTSEDDTKITQVIDTKVEKFSNLHIEGVSTECISSLFEHNCSKETLNDMDLSQDEGKEKLRVTEEDVHSRRTSNNVDLTRRYIRSTSPIFNIKKSKRKSNTPSPLVFDLDYFEKFEIIAFSLINSAIDKKIVSKMKDSQILGSELYLYGNENVCMDYTSSSLLDSESKYAQKTSIESDFDEDACNARVDDIIETNKDLLMNKTEKLPGTSSDNIINKNSNDKFIHRTEKTYEHIDYNLPQDEVLSKIKRTHNTETNALHNAESSISVEDEILFSSDEESEYTHKELQDLPFTCALETSFYNTSDVLDKTMYVGFQSANNKSIPISTDSLIKAENMNIDVEGKSLTKLVDFIDSGFKNDATSIETNLQNRDDGSVKDSKNTTLIIQINDNISTDIHFENDNNLTNAKKSLTNSSEIKSNNCRVILEDEEKTSHIISISDFSRRASQKRPLEGFVTANNKRIKLSDVALARCKKVFIDIDINDDFMLKADETIKDSKNKSTPGTGNNLDVKNINNMERNDQGIDDFGDLTDFNITDKVKSRTDKTKEFITIESNCLENLTQVNINDELIIQEFENIEMSFKEKECEFNTNSKIQNTGSPSNRLETAAKDSKLIEVEIIGETEDLLQDLHLTEIENKYFENENIPNKLGVYNDVVFERDEIKNTGLNRDGNIISENSSRNENRKKVKFDTNIKITEEIQYHGFKTASNKNIKISDNALINSRKLLNDVGLDDFTDYQNSIELKSYNHNVQNDTKTTLTENLPKKLGSLCVTTPFKGFQTASNKPIRVSEESLQKTKDIFSDIEVITTDINDNVPDSKENKVEVAALRNLQIFNNKEGDIPEVTFTKSDNTLKHIHLDGSNATIERNGEPMFHGFQTANNKPVKISKESIIKTKDIFKDIDFTNDVNDFDENNDCNRKQISGSTCFKTANHKPVAISKAALNNIKDIFEDMDSRNIVCDVNHINSNDNDNRTPISGFVGFQTGNNKPVAVSKEALKNTKHIFKDILVDSLNNVNKNEVIDIKNKLKNPIFKGFQTAKNKPVHISKESLKKTKSLFKNMDVLEMYEDSNEIIQVNDDTRAPISGFAGFQTASNKPVEISKESLKITKDVFKDIQETFKDVTENKHCIKSNEIKIPTFVGFDTANNKPVKISTEALLRRKNIFQNIDEDFSNSSNVTNENVKDRSFKNSSNKKVAFEICKNIFNDIDINKDFDDKDHRIISNISNYNKSVTKNVDTNLNKTSSHMDTAIGNDNNGTDYTLLETKTNKYDGRDITSDKSNQKYNDSHKIRRTNNSIANNKGHKEDGSEKDEQTNSNLNLEDNVNGLLSTQVLNNFENTLYTEDFHFTPPKVSRRSGSPILCCPKAKKRKQFEIPYRTAPIEKNNFQLPANLNIESQETYRFDENYKKRKIYYLKDLMNLETEYRLNNFQTNNVKVLNNLQDIDLRKFMFRQDKNNLNNDITSVEQLKTIFENSVDKKIIPENWFENHLEMVVRKLLQYENRFPNCMKNVCRVTNVLEQLKYRYDVELYNAKRPALRRILEKDDVPSKLLVLSVVGIYVDGVANNTVTDSTSNIELLLSDGWYALKATIDRMLATLVCSKEIIVGTKLATCGAELLNCEQGVSPWEDTSSVRLKLHGNCTRRARWDARLGYHRNAAILSTLGSVKMDGGKVAKLRVYITRVYPALYVEKFEDGSTVTRSERLEHLHQTKYESERAVLLEKLYEEVEKEISDHESEDSEFSIGDSGKRRCLETGSQISKCMKMCMDPNEFRNDLTSTQCKLLEEHTNKRREKLLEDIQNRVREKMKSRGLCVNRNVIQLLKIRVVGVEKRNEVKVTKGVLSIWKPNDAILDLIEEGAWIDVMNVVPTAIRLSEIHLSAGRQSIFNKYTPKNDSYKPILAAHKRQSLTISDLVSQPSMEYNEIDTVGLIIDIEPNLQEFDVNKHKYQNVYLADGNKSVASVNIWGGLKKFGYGNLFEMGQVVCCVNLQKRLGNNRNSIPGFRVTEFSYFTKTPKYKDLKLIFDNLCKNMAALDMTKFRAECFSVKNKLTAKVSNNISHFRLNYNDRERNYTDRAQNSSIFNYNSDDFKLSGLDFDSSFKQKEHQDISPKLLERKRQISEKIAKLKMYGEPPPLNNIYIINKSKNASNNYKSPLLVKNDNSVSDVNSAENVHKCNDISKSIIGKESVKCNLIVNRTHLKMEPVRLNFSKNNESNVSEVADPFAEEFDGSPPLSLD